MIELTKSAVEAIEYYKTNEVIMAFVTDQALQQVSDEMNNKGLSTTAKGVEVLIMSKRNANIKDRVNQYIDSGVFGCWMAAQ